MTELFLFFIGGVGACAIIVYWRIEFVLHQRRLFAIPIRIHVNGIRGKSTVTRIVAGCLRESGRKTIAKTTGSAACIIDDGGTDRPIFRNGAATILEQIDFVGQIKKGTDAMVVECMAIKPTYQAICESKIVQSNIGVLTNVREDHQDQMGESLEAIAESLLNTCPFGGVLISAEPNPLLRRIIGNVAETRNSRVVFVEPESVRDHELDQFDYFAFKENVAIGFAIEKELGISRENALRGMTSAAPDPGVLRLNTRQVRDRSLTWANLLAVNDRQSVITAYQRTRALQPTGKSIGLLNNRLDREDRAFRFAEIAACDLDLDYFVPTGAYESLIEKRLLDLGIAANRIISLGGQQVRSLDDMFDILFDRIEDSKLFIAGMVNIHTRQAEWLTEYFEGDDCD